MRQHRLAAARWSDEQDVVPPRGCDRHRTLGSLLPRDIGHIRGMRLAGAFDMRSDRLDPMTATQMLDELDQLIDGENLNPGDQRRLGCVCARNEDGSLTLLTNQVRHQDRPATRFDLSRQRELTKEAAAHGARVVDETAGAEQGNRQREIDRACILGDFRGEQIGDNTVVSQYHLARTDRRSHPNQSLADSATSQAHQGSLGETFATIALHRHRERFYSANRPGTDPCKTTHVFNPWYADSRRRRGGERNPYQPQTGRPGHFDPTRSAANTGTDSKSCELVF